MQGLFTFRNLTSLFLAVLFTQTAQANYELSIAEKNTMIKEEVASAQVMKELCPSIIGKNSKFDKNIDLLISEYLVDYSDKSATLQTIQNDPEYKSILNDAKNDIKDASAEDNKFACEEVANIQM
jgi:hypothetical protein